jgi:short-chain fatty acids transporter
VTRALRRLGALLAAFSERCVPDAFAFAVLLTFAVFGLALGLTGRGPVELVNDWYRGFWDLLAFAMQMSLVLVTGHALAGAPPIRRALARVSAWPTSGRSAVALTAFCAGTLGLVHWGLGLVTGALLAREVARSARRRGIRVHLPLAAAAGYVGLVVWHSGLSGSAPLLVNTQGHFLEASIGLVPLGETLFRPLNLAYVAAVLTLAPVLLASMHPDDDGIVEIQEDPTDPSPRPHAGPVRVVDRLAHSPILVWPIVLAGAVYLVPHFWRAGLLAVDLNVVNFTFLMLGLALHGSLAGYAGAATDGARAATGVILQFPFYAGIMGVMVHSGLVRIVADAFVALSTPLTFPFWVMVSAALVNLAVPSGGGQWAVQGPIVIEAARTLGVDTGRTVMAVVLGDQLTNMIQPFWALPLLGITGLRAGQLLGYTAVLMVVALVAAAAAITWLP